MRGLARRKAEMTGMGKKEKGGEGRNRGRRGKDEREEIGYVSSHPRELRDLRKQFPPNPDRKSVV